MDSSQKTFDLENNIQLVDPTRDALYAYSASSDREAKLSAPWKSNRQHYTHIRISAVALLKMVTHAREGGSLEVMGLMSGTVSGNTFVVTDAYRLPVEGTETRVNAYEDAYEYMTEFPRLSKMAGRMEDAVGWYHSHPGYGCWLSGIDVATQQGWQTQDPFVAVVIDPERTVAGGKVEIGAFRTYRNAVEANAGASEWATGEGGEGKRKKGDGVEGAGIKKTTTMATTSNVKAATGGANAALDKSTLSADKAKDLGLHADQYYALEVSHFRSTLDTAVLDALWRKYWTKTLSASGASRLGASNGDAVTRRIEGLAAGLIEVTRSQKSGEHAGAGVGDGTEPVRKGRGQPGFGQNSALEAVVKAAEAVEMEEQAGLMAQRVRDRVFGLDGASEDVADEVEGLVSHVSPSGGVTDQLQELQVQMQT